MRFLVENQTRTPYMGVKKLPVGGLGWNVRSNLARFHARLFRYSLRLARLKKVQVFKIA
jgi:hypothetical protein